MIFHMPFADWQVWQMKQEHSKVTLLGCVSVHGFGRHVLCPVQEAAILCMTQWVEVGRTKAPSQAGKRPWGS